MLRSRMLTPAFRYFAALALAAFAAAFVSAVGSSDQSLIAAISGPLTLGWKGGVGNHVGYTVLVSLAVVSATLAGILIAFRDADPEAEAQVAHTDSVPLTRAPSSTNFLPLVGTFSVGVIILGQISDRWITWAGIGLLFSVVAVWALRAWAERATGDPEVNKEIYQRFIEPLRVPVLSVIAVAVVVVGFSRVLLALSVTGAVVAFGVVGAFFLLAAGLVAARPAITKNALTILLFIGAIVVIAVGLAAAVVGERDFHHAEPVEGAAALVAPPAAPSDPVVVPGD